ncbi:MAG TPA: hypothetical protein VLU25_02745 [Acidobacteriota bacterium]|nr:hypothetical protein [Acidobacteriota bacterium]
MLRFLPDALDLIKVLEGAGGEVHVLEFPEGHSTRAWRPIIDDVLRPLLADD